MFYFLDTFYYYYAHHFNYYCDYSTNFWYLVMFIITILRIMHIMHMIRSIKIQWFPVFCYICSCFRWWVLWSSWSRWSSLVTHTSNTADSSVSFSFSCSKATTCHGAASAGIHSRYCWPKGRKGSRTKQIADFDRHYMPDGLPAPDASARGNAYAYRSDLKRKADVISRSLSEVFAHLTRGTASL